MKIKTIGVLLCVCLSVSGCGKTTTSNNASTNTQKEDKTRDQNKRKNFEEITFKDEDYLKLDDYQKGYQKMKKIGFTNEQIRELSKEEVKRYADAISAVTFSSRELVGDTKDNATQKKSGFINTASIESHSEPDNGRVELTRTLVKKTRNVFLASNRIEWVMPPTNRNTDYLMLTIPNNYAFNKNSFYGVYKYTEARNAYDYSKLKSYEVSRKSYSTTLYPKFTNLNSNVYTTFDLKFDLSSLGQVKAYKRLAYSGFKAYISCEFSNCDTPTPLLVRCEGEYVHIKNSLSLSPNFSIGINGVDASINFSTKVNRDVMSKIISITN